MVLLLAAMENVSAEDYTPSLDQETHSKFSRPKLFSGGIQFAVGNDLGTLPRIAAYLSVSRSIQLGLHARIAPNIAQTAYDYLPMIATEIRKVWIKDEDIDPISNSEYFGFSIGNYFAYDFDGSKLGPRPFLELSMGKYWMPFEHQPFGLDLDLGMTWLVPDITLTSGDIGERTTGGHLPGRSDQIFIMLGINLFYAIP